MLNNFIPDVGFPSSLLVVVCLLTICWLWIKSRRPYTKYNIPPFPVPPTFLFGHMLMVRDNSLEKFREWREKVGDIFSLDFGGEHNIVVSRYDNIKELLIKQGDKIPDAPRTFINDVTKECDKGIIGASGANWKEQRTATLSILRAFGVGKHVLAEKIEEEVKTYIRNLADLKGEPADVKILTNISVSNVICSILIGKRFEHTDPYFVRLMENITNFSSLSTKMPLLKQFPFLYYVPGDFFYAKRWTKSTLDINEQFSKAYIHDIKTSSNEEKEPTTFISAYLQERKKKQNKGERTSLDEANLVAVMRNLLAAGTDPTSNTILWCMIYMLHHTDVQEKVYQEIIANVGSERTPCMQDKQNLTYLNAVIQETQRMASVVPVAFRRQAGVPFQLNGYTFPKASVILPDIDSVLHDKKIWGDPEKFRPERFLDTTGNHVHHDAFIPFSMGRRACLGEALAKMELFLFLSSMFQRYKLLPEDSANLPSLKAAVVGVNRSPHPFKVRFLERI